MGQVNVTINDKHYRMACDDGQEAHLAGLAERLNASIEALRQRFGEIGDQRLTVMAAITFADQAAEAQRRIAQLEHQLAEAENAQLAARERENLDAEHAADAILAVADRIESLAARVSGGAGVGGNGNGNGGITMGNGRHNGAS